MGRTSGVLLGFGCVRTEDRPIVVLLGLEQFGRVSRELCTFALLFVRRSRRGIFGKGLEAHVCGAAGLGLGFEFDLLPRQTLERGRSILESFFDGRGVPFAKREDAGLDANERILFVALLDERREARPHGDLGALSYVAEEIFLDRDVSDFLIM